VHRRRARARLRLLQRPSLRKHRVNRPLGPPLPRPPGRVRRHRLPPLRRPV